jgi:hypothetical protein
MGLVSRTRSAAAHARQAVTQSWTNLKLTGPPTKTGIGDVKRAGCALLGCHCHQGSARTSGQLIPRMWPGQKAMQAIRSHMREQPERRGVRDTLAAMVATRTPIIRGWRHDCRVGHAPKQLQDLDRYGRHRVGQWIPARLTRSTPPDPLQALYRTSGLESFSARGRCGPRP